MCCRWLRRSPTGQSPLLQRKYQAGARRRAADALPDRAATVASWDDAALPGISLADLDGRIFDEYRHRGVRSRRLPPQALNESDEAVIEPLRLPRLVQRHLPGGDLPRPAGGHEGGGRERRGPQGLRDAGVHPDPRPRRPHHPSQRSPAPPGLGASGFLGSSLCTVGNLKDLYMGGRARGSPCQLFRLLLVSLGKSPVALDRGPVRRRHVIRLPQSSFGGISDPFMVASNL